MGEMESYNKQSSQRASNFSLRPPPEVSLGAVLAYSSIPSNRRTYSMKTSKETAGSALTPMSRIRSGEKTIQGRVTLRWQRLACYLAGCQQSRFNLSECSRCEQP